MGLSAGIAGVKEIYGSDISARPWGIELSADSKIRFKKIFIPVTPYFFMAISLCENENNKDYSDPNLLIEANSSAGLLTGIGSQYPLQPETHPY